MAAVLNRPAAARRPGRTLRLAGLAALVGGLHLGALDRFLVDRLGEGAGERGMRRIEVAFVKELAPAEPPAVVAAPAPAPAAPAARQAVRPAPKASDPVPAPEAPPPEPLLPAEPPRPPPPEPAPVVAAAEAPPAPEPAASAAEVAVAASAPAAAASVAATAIASGAVAFEWPPSTRLSYELRGNYRGEVQGSASVEWIRVQQRYQVHMEALVGPPFAPLLARRISSEGELTDNGLVPRRFEGEQRVAFSKRRWSMRFDDERIVLPDGRELPPAAGVQDEASQFVQLAWQFTMRPELLVPGRSVAFPLALPRRVEGWTYDAVEEELLRLPFGEVPTVHLKPRRQATKAGDLAVEMWIAPTLQNLPVRILIHQDAQTFIDLSLKSPPLQAAK